MGAIPTEYRGIRFRSRLEATWASFFDLLNWSWEYEPFDLRGYIPDFVLRFVGPIIVEVKPEPTWRALGKYCDKIEKSGWHDPALIVASGPEIIRYEWSGEQYICLGLSGVPGDDPNAIDPDLWGGAGLHLCGLCGRYSPRVFPGYNACLLCGCGKVGTPIPFLDPDSDDAKSKQVVCKPLDVDLIRSLWATAKNRVQWKGEFGA